MQIEQSTVGKVLSRRAIMPPTEGLFSTSTTSNPPSAQSSAACIPATPPPMTNTRLLILKREATSDLFCFAFSTASFIASIALLVFNSLSSPIHEQCSRILAISKKYRFSPAFSTVRRNVSSCIRGEQAATTTRSSFSRLIASLISSWPGSEHVYM